MLSRSLPIPVPEVAAAAAAAKEERRAAKIVRLARPISTDDRITNRRKITAVEVEAGSAIAAVAADAPDLVRVPDRVNIDTSVMNGMSVFYSSA